MAEAQARAREAADRIALRIRRGGLLPARYAYGTRPLREEIVREIHGHHGDVVAAITRNAYGALILNTAHVMFIDVDLGEPGIIRGLLTWVAKALAQSRLAKIGDRTGTALAKVRRWTDAHPAWGFRVYQTRAGLRYLATHALFEPGGEESKEVMQFLGCDPHYVQLCQAQQSFRARLTPKPWRCGIQLPPARFPWQSAVEEGAMRAWEAHYSAASEVVATCSLIAMIGNSHIDSAVAPIVKLHDEYTRAEAVLPLA